MSGEGYVRPDVLDQNCESRQALELISDKWTTLIVYALIDGPRRHGELRRTVDGISQKMLTQTLRTLERDGLVTREVTPSVPVRVDYELTELGRSLLPVLALMKAWAEEHMSRVLEAQEHYDRGQAVSA